MRLAPQEEILSVDELTARIRRAIVESLGLRNISLKGELSGLKRHESGHVYFSLLGKETRIACVLFRSSVTPVVAALRDGDEVFVKGSLDVYGARGLYQLYALLVLPLGEGAKARAKEMLRKRLALEGLFSPQNKRPLPLFPERVAIITSPTGAALQDVLKVSYSRWPYSELIVVPSLMQGVDAPDEIVSAFSKCAFLNGLSLVMLVRGGGSRSDLDTFDDERVVRAVRSCPVPVITGVGHQIDSTLSDLAADAFAPTPSAAAEKVFPDGKELAAYTDGAFHSLVANILKINEKYEVALTDTCGRLAFAVAKGIILPLEGHLDTAKSCLLSSAAHMISDAETKLAAVAGALHNASPLNILARGYAICYRESGEILREVTGLSFGDAIRICMRDGSFRAVVTEKRKAG